MNITFIKEDIINTKGGNRNGIGRAVKTTKHKFRIIEYGTRYRVKKRFWKFYFYIRTKFKVLEFDDFSDVVRFVVEQKRK